jgi:hypothetical protein
MNKKMLLPLFLLFCSTITQTVVISFQTVKRSTPHSLLNQCTIDAGREEELCYRLEILDAISTLLGLKADPSKQFNGQSALERATADNHSEILLLFEQQQTEETK